MHFLQFFDFELAENRAWMHFLKFFDFELAEKSVNPLILFKYGLS
jgi:hypothetical protein